MNQEGHDIEVCILRLAQVLGERQWRMASAESCTGGWIAKCCTDLAGSSAWFERGFVTYSNEAKMEMLGVKSATLEESGAVSEPVAQEMARGACHSSHADVALSVTGIAGPDGGTAEKPVGMVCFSWFLQGPAVFSETCYFEGNRDAVRRQAVLQALSGMLERIDN